MTFIDSLKISLVLFFLLVSGIVFGQGKRDVQEESGYVVVGFSVNSADGVRNVYVMKGISPEIDEQAIRFVKEKHDPKAGRSASYFLPVRMKLHAVMPTAGQEVKEIKLAWEEDKVQQKDLVQIQQENEWNLDFYLGAVITGIQKKRLETKVYNQFWLKSSTIPAGINSQQLLPLVQLCFDTNELYARKLKKGIKKSRFKSIYSDVIDLKELEEELKGERDIRIIKILKETEHGSNAAALGKWQEQIRKELKKLKRFQ